MDETQMKKMRVNFCVGFVLFLIAIVLFVLGLLGILNILKTIAIDIVNFILSIFGFATFSISLKLMAPLIKYAYIKIKFLFIKKRQKNHKKSNSKEQKNSTDKFISDLSDFHEYLLSQQSKLNNSNDKCHNGKSKNKLRKYKILFWFACFFACISSVFSLIYFLPRYIAFGSVNATLLILLMILTVALCLSQILFIRKYYKSYLTPDNNRTKEIWAWICYCLGVLSLGSGLGTQISLIRGSYDASYYDFVYLVHIATYILGFIGCGISFILFLGIKRSTTYAHVICILLCLALIVFGVSRILVDSSSDKISNGFTYTFDDTDGISITGYVNTSVEILEVPCEIDGKKVTSILGKSFKNFSNLKNVLIPESVMTIGDSVFSGCSKLESLTLPFVGYWSEGRTTNDEYVKCCRPIGYLFGTNSFLNAVEVKQYFDGIPLESTTIKNNYQSTYYIPKNLKQVCVMSGEICSGAFYGCNLIERITIGNEVTSIGESAFKNCSSLTGIAIPGSVRSIGKDAFRDCSNLANLIIADGVMDIGEAAFKNCNKIESATMSTDAISYIPKSNLKNVVITSGDSIKNSAFNGCSKLENITLPFIGGSRKSSNDTYQYPLGYIFGTSSYTGGTVITQFYYGSTLSSTTSTKYYIPSTLKSITITGGNLLYGAFYGCSGLTNITIANDLTFISEKTFYGCSGLKSVTIPDSVNYICAGAFEGCNNLVKKLNGVSYVDNWVIDCDSTVKSVNLKNNVRGIADCSFYNCKLLIEILLPDNILAIGDNTFNGCSSLEKITIPQNIRSIGRNAFEGCKSLQNVQFLEINNWYFVDALGVSTYIRREDLQSETTAAQYLISTFNNYKWIRL